MPDDKKTPGPRKKATLVALRTPASGTAPPAKKAATRAPRSAARPAAAAAPAAKAAARKPAARKPAATKAAPKEHKAARGAPRPATGVSVATAPPKKVAPRPAKAPRRAAPAKARAAEPPVSPDPEGFFVARVRGEDAVRDAPHPLLEGAAWDEEPLPSALEEGLGELPWGYGDDTLVALPRDPHTLFLYWDHARETLQRAFEGLDHARAQLWLFVRGAGWERVRVLDFALESRGYYVHDLEPGRVYRAEIHLVDRGGREKLVPQASSPVALPPVGPSPVVDDRFVRIPWEYPLPRLLGPGAPGGPFSEELRAMLARLSDWSRFRTGPEGAPGAGGMGGRPTSPAGGAGGGPSSPSSPLGPFGKGGR